jgi:hypothetical protein
MWVFFPYIKIQHDIFFAANQTTERSLQITGLEMAICHKGA